MKKRILYALLVGLLLSPTAIASAGLRERIWRQDPCLAWIVDHENRSWSPTQYGLGGSYGLPQAQPSSKMASAGKDWATNPLTQLRWMRGYVNGRYGGSCNAKAYWIQHHNY